MITAVRRNGHFCCRFVANLLKYLCAKNYENIVMFDKVIAKIIRVQFVLPHSVFSVTLSDPNPDFEGTLLSTLNIWETTQVRAIVSVERQ